MTSKDKLLMLIAFAIPVIITIFWDFLIAFALVIVLSIGLFATKNLPKREITLIVVLFFIFAFVYYMYYTPALFIAKNSGTVLSDNWFEGLNWIKNNTNECDVVATYWDPGHFITGIARRPVVFDGASQGNLFTRTWNYNQEGVFVDKYDNNINHIVLYKGGNKTTARIQDISTTLLTSNETLAVSILKEYRKPGCDMYYIASSDLIGKSHWWTYFSTWNPVDKKGTPYNYIPIQLGSAKPDIKQNAVIYTYPFSQTDSFVIYQINNSLIVFLQQQGTAEPLKVSKYVYFTSDGVGRVFTQNDAKVEGTVWIEPGNRAILFIPPQLEDAMFTRMFLYNGLGLNNFDYVNNWGGEVKLFKVNFND